jgi:hypothetical protein
MVVVVVGLRTAGQTLNTLTSSLERLCSKEERTWKDRIFNQMRLVSVFLLSSFSLKKKEHMIIDEENHIFVFFVIFLLI